MLVANFMTAGNCCSDHSILVSVIVTWIGLSTWLVPSVVNLPFVTRSFGVIMLELSTGADRPYGTLTDEEVMQQIIVDQAIKLDKPNLNVNYADRWWVTHVWRKTFAVKIN